MSAVGALPPWVVRLVAGLVEHEDTHAAGDNSCVAALLEPVPSEVLTFAEGWAQGAAYARREVTPS